MEFLRMREYKWQQYEKFKPFGASALLHMAWQEEECGWISEDILRVSVCVHTMQCSVSMCKNLPTSRRITISFSAYIHLNRINYRLPIKCNLSLFACCCRRRHDVRAFRCSVAVCASLVFISATRSRNVCRDRCRRIDWGRIRKIEFGNETPALAWFHWTEKWYNFV